jgi:hypothetical protein
MAAWKRAASVYQAMVEEEDPVVRRWSGWVQAAAVLVGGLAVSACGGADASVADDAGLVALGARGSGNGDDGSDTTAAGADTTTMAGAATSDGGPGDVTTGAANGATTTAAGETTTGGANGDTTTGDGADTNTGGGDAGPGSPA